jgi:hypothetical protein
MKNKAIAIVFFSSFVCRIDKIDIYSSFHLKEAIEEIQDDLIINDGKKYQLFRRKNAYHYGSFHMEIYQGN